MHNNQEEEGIKRNGRVSHFFYHTSFLRDEPGRIFEIKRTPGPVRITTPSQKKKKKQEPIIIIIIIIVVILMMLMMVMKMKIIMKNGDEDYYFLPTYTSKRKKTKTFT